MFGLAKLLYLRYTVLKPHLIRVMKGVDEELLINVLFCFRAENPIILTCILNVLRQYSTCESTKDRKELRNNQENYVVVHISLVTPFPDGSAIHLFWLIIVVVSFELKEVTGCLMAN